MILARSVPAEGRSRAWVDGRMAPLGALGEAAAELVEIHGQHEHRALVTAAAQRDVLDAFAGTDLSRVRALRSQLRALDDALAALGGDEQQRAREADVLRYQVDEIAAAHLEDPDEEAALRREEDRLADAGAYREAALGAVELLEPAGGEGGALDLLGLRRGRAGRARGLRRLPRARWPRRPSSSPTWPARCATRSRAGRTTRPAWPRCRSAGACWRELRRKYGEDLAAVMAYGAGGCGPAGRARGRRGRGGPAAGRARRAPRRAGRGRGGRARRAGPAPPARSAQRVGERLGALAMAGARLEVRVAPDGHRRAGRAGCSGPTSANRCSRWPGPRRAASWPGPCWPSGWSAWAGPRRMVFDEVDAGVGGAAALALGEALHEVARRAPGPGRDPPGPGGLAGRRADQRGQARRRGAAP